MTQLELLLLLHRDPAIEWTTERAAVEMRFPPPWAAEHLARFAEGGLLASSGGADPSYRYAPDGDKAATMDELAELYRRRRTSVTSLIFSPAPDEVRLLSDAFRIWRREEDD